MATPTSQQMYEEIVGMRKQMPQMKPMPTQDDFYRGILGRANNLTPQYEKLGQLESEAYATPETSLKSFDKQYGRGVGKGLGMASEMGSSLGTMGNRYATADTMRRAIEAQRGGIADLAGNLYQSQQLQRQAELEDFQNRYKMSNDLYGMTLQREQMEEAKLAAARAARGGGGRGGSGGGGYGYGMGVRPSNGVPTQSGEQYFEVPDQQPQAIPAPSNPLTDAVNYALNRNPLTLSLDYATRDKEGRKQLVKDVTKEFNPIVKGGLNIANTLRGFGLV